jgi:hypothetical protein
MFLSSSTRGFLEQRHVLAILSALRPVRWLSTSLTVRDLLRFLHRVHRLSRDQALMHVMWLAKYDLVSFGAPELIPPEDGSDGTTDGR